MTSSFDEAKVRYVACLHAKIDAHGAYKFSTGVNREEALAAEDDFWSARSNLYATIGIWKALLFELRLALRA